MKSLSTKLKAAALVGAMAVTACAGAVIANASEDVVLNFYYWDEGQTPGMDAAIALFEEQNPNIKIESTVIPWSDYFTKLQTALPAGTGPDVFWVNIHAAQFANAGLLLDLKDLIAEAGIDISNYPQASLDVMKFDTEDAIYGMPKDFQSVGIYYNKGIFDEMGVPYPQADWTWEDFRETAIQLTNDDHYGYASFIGYPNFRSFEVSNGAVYTNEDKTESLLNSPESVEALQFLHDLMYVDHASPTGAEMAEIEASDMFRNGMVAMMADGSWCKNTYYEALGDDLAVIEMPQNAVKAIPDGGGLCYGIASNGKNIEASWTFVEFLASAEAQIAAIPAGIPANKEAQAVWLEQNSNVDGISYLVDCEPYCKGNPTYAYQTIGECETYENEAMSAIFLDENADIQSIMDDMAAKINKTIADAAK